MFFCGLKTGVLFQELKGKMTICFELDWGVDAR